MRAPLEQIERVVSYISDTMTTAQRVEFEQELANDQALQEQLKFQQQLAQAVQRRALRSEIASAAKGYGGGGASGMAKALLIAGLVIVAGAIGYALLTRKSTADTKKPVTAQTQADVTESRGVTGYPKPVVAKKTAAAPVAYQQGFTTRANLFVPTTFAPAATGWQPWVPFERQYFSFDPAKGTTIEAAGGTLIIVPANAFVNEKGAVETKTVNFELIEALDFADMIAYNLTTLSDGKALSSGGMLHIEARSGGKTLRIDPERPLYVEIPTEKCVPGMMAWKGEEVDGALNWTNPQPLKRYLTPVDFKLLDFVPEGFDDEVAALLPIGKHQTTSKALVDSLYYALSATQQTNWETEAAVKNDLAPMRRGGGEAAGRITNSDGNPLQGVTVSYPVGNRWIKTVTDRSGTFSIAPGQTDVRFSLAGYQDVVKSNVGFGVDRMTFLEVNFEPAMEQDMALQGGCYIGPAALQAIQTPVFSNTFFATKEFEARLRELHKLKNGAVLFELYLDNLGKDLSEVDAMVAKSLTGPAKEIFRQFSAEGLTNVENASIHQEQLKAYYNEKRTAFQRETEAAHTAYQQQTIAQLQQLRYTLDGLQRQPFEVRAAAVTGKQSSRGKGATRMRESLLPAKSVANSAAYGTTWYEPGWMNIDCYLRAVSKGTPVMVNINAGVGGSDRKIYQCLDLLKTIVPLYMKDGVASAKFPDPSVSESRKMAFTFCVGLERLGDNQVLYAERRYNPYETPNVVLSWNTISGDELLDRLRALSPVNNNLIKDLEAEAEYVEKVLANQKKANAVKREMQAINDRREREAAMMRKLLGFIDQCDAESFPLPVPPPGKQKKSDVFPSASTPSSPAPVPQGRN